MVYSFNGGLYNWGENKNGEPLSVMIHERSWDILLNQKGRV